MKLELITCALVVFQRARLGLQCLPQTTGLRKPPQFNPTRGTHAHVSNPNETMFLPLLLHIVVA